MVIPSCSSGDGGLTNILSLTSQKKNHHCSLNTLPLHVIYLFSHHRSKRRLRRTDCLVSVGANRLTDLHIYGVRFRPKDPAALNHLIISDHSVWFIMVCMLHSFTCKSSFSSDHFIMICMLTGLHSTQCIQIISSSNQNFIRSSSWRSLSNLCL